MRCLIHVFAVDLKAVTFILMISGLARSQTTLSFTTSTGTPATEAPTSASQTTSGDPITSSDPCISYTVLDQPWRSTNNSNNTNLMCDQYYTWVGWYRFFYQGLSAHMPEWCVPEQRCGTHAPLWLDGSHPRQEDGVVTRQVCGHWSGNCCYFRSNPIRVKACPGNYYVYELVQPSTCHLAYCTDENTTFPAVNHTMVLPTTAVPTTSGDAITSSDPCISYTVLDQPWRSTNNSNNTNLMCDMFYTWVGWYRFFYQGLSAHMPEWCVPEQRCGTHAPLWLDGSHPRQEDGVVTRQVCGHWSGNCCYFRSNPIRVKACPGNYYVYELVQPSNCHLAYCTDEYTVTPPMPTTVPTTAGVIGVRLKVVSSRNVTEAFINGTFLKELQNELAKRGVQNITSIRQRHFEKINP